MKWFCPLFIFCGMMCAATSGVKAQTGTPSDPWIINFPNNGSGTENITQSGYYTITGTGAGTTARQIVVGTTQNPVTANITLNNVRITSANCAFTISAGSTVHLTLSGNNTLTSGSGYAGLHVPENATLTIEGTGSLTVTGGAGSNSNSTAGAAGIGGNSNENTNSGTIIINGGEIIAKGGDGGASNSGGGAGIGGGSGNGSNGAGGGTNGPIIINGGVITATGGNGGGGSGGGGGAGIGGGGAGHSSNSGGSNNSGITINSGTINATGGSADTGCGGAGIGGGGALNSDRGGKGNIIDIDYYANITAIGGGGGKSSSCPAPGIGNGGQTVSNNNKITITRQPVDIIVAIGYIAGSTLNLQATVDPSGLPNFQWYEYNESTGTSTLVSGIQTTSTFSIPTTLSAGDHYFYCVVSAASAPNVSSNLVKVKVLASPVKSIELLIENQPLMFESRIVGYSIAPTISVTIRNTGSFPFTGASNNLVITYHDQKKDGTTPFNFLSDPPNIADLAVNRSVVFTLSPVTGLPLGMYTATVTVGDGGDVSESFNVQFMVIKREIKSIEVIQDPVKMIYNEGQSLDLSGLEVKLTYYTADVNGKFDDMVAFADFVEHGIYTIPSDHATLNLSHNGSTVIVRYSNLIFANTGPLSVKAELKPALLSYSIPVNHVYNGKPQGIGVVQAATGVAGLGAITVKYNGTVGNPTNAATYTVTADVAAGENYVAATGIVLGTYTIAKKLLNITAGNKVYDGKRDAAITLVTADIAEGDDVKVQWTSAVFANANIGNGKTVTVSGLSLAGNDAVNYRLTNSVITLSANITKKSLNNAMIAAIGNQTYNGSEIKPVPTVTDGAPSIIATLDYSVSYLGNINAGTATATITATINGNYSGSASVTFTINPKTISIATVAPLVKIYDGVSNATPGAVTFSGLIQTTDLKVDVDYTVVARFTGGDYNAGNSKPYTYTVSMGNTTMAKNYSLSANTKSDTNGAINKATGLAAMEAPIIIIPINLTSLQTTDLNNLIVLNKVDYGTRSYSLGAFADVGGGNNVLTSQPVLSGTNLNYTGNGKGSGSATQVIRITTTNYTNINVTIIFTATGKALAMLEFEDGSDEYDGTPKSHETATYNGSGNLITYAYVGTDYGPTGHAPTNAGEYMVTATYEDEAYYGQKQVIFDIARKVLDIVNAEHTKEYDGTTDADDAVVMLSGIVPGDDNDFSVILTAEYIETDAGAKNLNIANISMVGDKAGNYSVSPRNNVDNTLAGITPRTVSIAGFDISKTYDGNINVIGSFGDLEFERLVDGETASVDESRITAATYAESRATTHIVTFKGAFSMTPDGMNPVNPANYLVMQPTDVTGEITKAVLTDAHLKFADPTTLSHTYTGLPQGIGSVDVIDGMEGLGFVTVYYEGVAATSYTKSSIAPTNVGTYEVTVDIAGGTNFEEATDISLCHYVIGKAPLTITGFNIIKIYDGDNTVTGFGNLEFAGLVNGETAAVDISGITKATYVSADMGANIPVAYTGVFGMAEGGKANPENYDIMQPENLVGRIRPEILPTYLINISVNNNEFGSATGGGTFNEDDEATVTATAKSNYRFVNWTINGKIVSIENPYSFIVTEDLNLVANFETETEFTLLPFEEYVITKWDNNTFMLDLRKLKNEYDITGCKWYENYNVIGEDFTYSAGAQRTDKLRTGVPYRFVLSTGSHGVLRSTDYFVENINIAALSAYPNPVQSGNMLTIEGVAEGSPIDVYNQVGVRVSHTIATGNTATITLRVPEGLYVIRTKNGEIKVIITN